MKTAWLILTVLIMGCSNVSFADSAIDTSYHYTSSGTPMSGQSWEDKPLTPVGSDQHNTDPVGDQTKVLVSGAREKHTDIHPEVMTQKEMNRINAELASIHKQLDGIQATQAHDVTGTMTEVTP